MRHPGGRGLSDYEEYLGFKESELQGKVILDLGSGSKEKLSQELKEAGINASVFSVNPDYSLPKYRKIINNQEHWQKQSVASLAQSLPFKDNTFDRIYALQSITYYEDAAEKPDHAKQWAAEIARVLKPGGEARLGEILGMKGKQKQEAYQQLIEQLNSLGLDAKIEEFKIRETKPLTRHRLIITKPQIQ